MPQSARTSGSRPMSLLPPVPRRWSRWIDVAAVLGGAAIATGAPLVALDHRARAGMLALSASAAPSDKVIVVEVGAADLDASRCTDVLVSALTQGKARGALLLPPADVFCGTRAAPLMRSLGRAALTMGE